MMFKSLMRDKDGNSSSGAYFCRNVVGRLGVVAGDVSLLLSRWFDVAP